MMDQERSKLGRLFDVRLVKRLLWDQGLLPAWALWLIWWPLPWLRLGWVQEVTGQLLVRHADAETGKALDYTWQSARGMMIAAELGTCAGVGPRFKVEMGKAA